MNFSILKSPVQSPEEIQKHRILDRDEESLGEASSLNSIIMLEEEEIVTAEEIPPEVLEAMKSLAKEVTGHNRKC